MTLLGSAAAAPEEQQQHDAQPNPQRLRGHYAMEPLCVVESMHLELPVPKQIQGFVRDANITPTGAVPVFTNHQSLVRERAPNVVNKLQ